MPNTTDFIQDALKILANTLQVEFDYVIQQDEMVIDCNQDKLVPMPWGILVIEPYVADFIVNESILMLIIELKGDLGCFFSYNTINNICYFNILDTNLLDNASFDHDKSIIQNCLDLDKGTKVSWQMDLEDPEPMWTEADRKTA